MTVQMNVASRVQHWMQAARRQMGQPSAQQNVGDWERIGSAVAGGVLLLNGLTKLKSASGWLSALAGGALLYRGLSGSCAAYRAMGIDTRQEHGPATAIAAGRGVKVEKEIVVQRPAAELYQFWRRLENLPQIMKHLIAVEQLSEVRSKWQAHGLGEQVVQWTADIIVDRPNEVISWRSLPGGDVATAGAVHFFPLPEGNGTRVRVAIEYDPPAGKMGDQVAGWFGQSLEDKLEEDLRNFQAFMESPAEQPVGPAV